MTTETNTQQNQPVRLIDAVICVFFGYALVVNYNAMCRIQNSIGYDLGPHIFLTPIDRMMPFVPSFALIYLSVYVVPTLVLFESLYRWRKQRKIFISNIFLVLFAYFVTVNAQIFMPASSVSLMSWNALTYSDNWTDYLLKLQVLAYSSSGFFGAFPSPHIVSGWSCCRLAKSGNRYFYAAIVVWFALMTLSTFLLKFHFVVDAIAAVLIVEAFWYARAKAPWFRDRWARFIDNPNPWLAGTFSYLIGLASVSYIYF